MSASKINNWDTVASAVFFFQQKTRVKFQIADPYLKL